MLDVPGRARPYLRRAYSVADADAASGEVEFLVKTIGPGTAALVQEGSDVTIVTYGATVYRSRQAAKAFTEETGRSVEILDLRSLSPYDWEAIA
jgi:pyruvate/2-oxoglutarate/acetoin dehydrogenase E1 component